MIFQTNVNCEETVRNKKPVCINSWSMPGDQCQYGFAGGCERVDLRFGWKQSGLGGKW